MHHVRRPNALTSAARAAAVAALAASALHAQSVLEIIRPVGGGCLEARGVSPDGQIVVGLGQPTCPLAPGPASEGFTWTQSGGIVAVPQLDVIYAVNSDASVLLGRTGSAPGSIWAVTPFGQQAVDLVPSPSFGACLNDAGNVVVGELADGTGGYHSPGAAPVAVTCGAPCEESVASVSADGQVLVGHRAEAPASAMRWFVGGGSEVIVPGDGSVEYFAQVCNADGSVVAGSIDDGSGVQNAFLWSEASGFRVLDGGEKDFDEVTFRAMSDDGTRAVAQVLVGGPRSIPAVWTDATGLLLLEDLLIEQGTDMQGMILWRANDLSADGEWIVGWAEETFPPLENPGYRVEFAMPWANLGGGLAGSLGTPRLVGAGSPVAGNPMSVSLSGVPPGAFGIVIAGFSELDPPLPVGGGTLVPFPDIVEPVVADGSGELTIPFTWSPAAVDVFVQVWIVDLTGPEGVTASNALGVSVF